MDIQKKRVNAVLIIISLFSVLQAQVWEVHVFYRPNLENLKIEVEIDTLSSGAPYSIEFQDNILGQNFKDSFRVDEKLIFTNNGFDLKSENRSFSYVIDLSNTTNVPTKALIHFREILLVNWQEIFFKEPSNNKIDARIFFHFEDKVYDLGANELAAWKANPSKINLLKIYVEVNNIKIYTNLASPKLEELLNSTLKEFNYIDSMESKEVVLIFSNEGYECGGATFTDLSIVYIDAATSQDQGLTLIQKILIHELFHFVLPYEIVSKDKEGSNMNWFSEAAPEYFTLRYLLKYDLISEREFLDEMEQKMRQAKEFDHLTLNELSLNVYDHPEYYQAFYSKGNLALWLLELKIKELNDFNSDFQELIERSQPKWNNTDSKEQRKELEAFTYNLVYQNRDFQWNKFLPTIGLIYEKQVVLPMDKKDTEARIRLENIHFNKMANVEQKMNWQRFIHD